MLGVWLLLAWLFACLRTDQRRPGRRRTPTPTLIVATTPTYPRNQRKPEWVVTEVLRLKALTPNLGCRLIAEIFNRRHGIEYHSTVGKTFVADTLRRHKVELLRLRRELKHRVPPPMPTNQVWALDLTGKADLTGRQQLILGLIDHGSRTCLRLREIADKSSLTILQHLADVLRQFGFPNPDIS